MASSSTPSGSGTSPYVYDFKFSSVVPASITGEDKIHDLNNLDLLMKLHYIRGIYFFNKDAARGFEITDLKRPMFEWLKLYPAVAGRIRRPAAADDIDVEEDGGGRWRPFVKCNDSGVRIVEAKCSKTIDELVDSGDYWAGGCDELELVQNQVIGPDLGFAPLVFVQFTWFKCGGISVGLSWSHILGDAFSASDFINKWGQILANDHQLPSKHIAMPIMITKNDFKVPSSFAKIPFSIKMVDPVGDHWLTINKKSKMQMHSLHLTENQLNRLLSKASELGSTTELSVKVMPFFDLMSAVIWKSLAKIRGESEPKIVTICRNDYSCDRNVEPLRNSQVISTVEAANLKVGGANLLELVNLIELKQKDERSLIEEFMETGKGKYDYILYGANLTFINLEGSNIYDLEMNGKKPVFANYSLSGVGDKGAVLVLPGPGSSKDGRIVNLILPPYEVADLKDELRKEWSLF